MNIIKIDQLNGNFVCKSSEQGNNDYYLTIEESINNALLLI